MTSWQSKANTATYYIIIYLALPRTKIHMVLWHIKWLKLRSRNSTFSLPATHTHTHKVAISWHTQEYLFHISSGAYKLSCTLDKGKSERQFCWKCVLLCNLVSTKVSLPLVALCVTERKFCVLFCWKYECFCISVFLSVHCHVRLRK